jgi:acyl-CoA synthetase (AMP-forming)/AMP-acid ligase II
MAVDIPDRSWAPASFPAYVPTVPNLLADGSSRWPERDSVVTPEVRLTYRQLDDQSRRLAARLVREGVGKGSRVGILFPNSARWVVTWAAVARIGAVALPVNTFYKPAELRTFLRHADVQFIVGTGRFIQHDYLQRLETIAPELSAAGPGVLFLPSLPHLRRVLLWEDSDRRWATGGIGELDQEIPHDLAAIVAGMEADVVPSDDLLITYTSGSTGEPKGVVHSHGGVVRHARNLAALSGMDESSRAWTPMPLCWVGGFAFTLLRALAVGGCFITQEVFEAGAALRMMKTERVTNVSAWPGIAKTLMEHPDYPSTDLSSVRGGSFYEALPQGERPADQGLTVTSLGMSETCGPHTFWLPSEEVTGSPEEYRGSFGHEVPGTQHRIVDSETGEDVAEGEEGEVWVRGYNLMTGMYKKERSEVFDADGWYHTGDRGLFRDGWFFFTGRQTDLIKTRGSNVAPAEVEKVLVALPEVKLAYVVGVPHDDDGEQVVAMIVPWSEAGSVSVPSVLERLREQLSSYKVPRHVFVFTDAEVPWLVSQKVDRRALQEMASKLVAAEPAR